MRNCFSFKKPRVSSSKIFAAVTIAAVSLHSACGRDEVSIVSDATLADLSRRDFSAEHSAGCLASGCHQQLAENRWVHGPTAVQACSYCHDEVGQTVDEHRFESAVASRDLCLRCHPSELADEFIHEPYGSANCVGCHDPHGGSHKNFLLTDQVQDLCRSCHPEDAVSVSHQPREAGDCLSCHRSHSSRNEHLLLRPETELCTACHREFRGFLPENIQEAGLVGKTHPVLLTDGCLACHQAHGSEHASMLQNDLHDTCQRCHADLHSGMEDAEVVHAPFGEKHACVKCHTPHASVYDGLLTSSPGEVCFSCHAEAVETVSGRVLQNVQQQIAEARVVHHPVEEGDCTACHIAHFSQQRSLLRLKYPHKIYREFSGGSYDLCFQCHDSNMVEKNGVGFTGFRNGEQNLHFVHVNAEKGRACDICHDPHASDGFRLVRESYPFGPSRWPLPLGFSATADGGSCTSACHEELSYKR